MSRTLALISAGWDSAQAAASRGSRGEALQGLRNLLARPGLPAEIAGDAHRLAGEIELEGERFVRARRHFRAAAQLSPCHARTLYLWGLAQEQDPHGSDLIAARKFRQAAKLEPENAVYRAAYGRAAIRCERIDHGVRELLEAADKAAGNIPIVRVVVEGLIEARRFGTARRVLMQARFLALRAADDREIESLDDRVRFETARCKQREASRRRLDADFAMEGGRAVLPFIRTVAVATDGTEKVGTNVRRDVLTITRPHLPRFKVRRADV